MKLCVPPGGPRLRSKQVSSAGSDDKVVGERHLDDISYYAWKDALLLLLGVTKSVLAILVFSLCFWDLGFCGQK